MRASTAEKDSARAKRQNAFDFIRLVAALAVVVEHSVHHLDVAFLWHHPDDALWFNGGVATFFILSGMMVYQSGQRMYADGRSWREYFRNRALRIMPAIYVYFVALVLLLLATQFLRPTDLLTTQFAAFFASNLFLISVWSPPLLNDFGIGTVNGSLWTIPVEVSFYAIVPAIVVLAARRGWRTAMVSVATLAAIGVIAYGLAGATASEALIWKLFGVTFAPYLWWFAIGIVWTKLWPHVIKSGWIAAACIVLYFAIAKLPLETGPAHIANAVAALPLSYAVIWFGYNAPRALGKFTSRIGDLSFSVYIWHMIVINFLVSWGARAWHVNGTVLIAGVMLVSSAIAFMSWHLVEKRALGRKKYSSADGQPVPYRLSLRRPRSNAAHAGQDSERRPGRRSK